MSAPTLVMLHGWGVNGAVFSSLLPYLEGLDIRVVNLPGFGDAAAEPAHDHIDGLARALADKVPQDAVWLGWSLGGLAATQAAIKGYGRPRALITLASSPAFVADAHWPGIKPMVLKQFAGALDGDLQQVIDRFLAIQAMGAPSAKADIKVLREKVAQRALPSLAALAGGLKSSITPISGPNWPVWGYPFCASTGAWTPWYRSNRRPWWMNWPRPVAAMCLNMLPTRPLFPTPKKRLKSCAILSLHCEEGIDRHLAKLAIWRTL